jgi:O2-independent ubiquinone biosynthesis protein UbiV
VEVSVSKIGLTLGPVLFNWDADRLRAFYKGIAENSKFDRVHLGEVVCGKRMPFTDAVWMDAIGWLEDAGKEVVLSTLSLPASPRERKTIADFCQGDHLIEMNDVTALPARTGQPFVVGPLVNVYNERAAQFFAARGAVAACLPVELPLAAVGVIARACPELEIEVFAFGRLPLALSSRCYHARLHGLHKDSCQFVCEKDPDGLAVDTIDGQKFLAVNGVQTLSQDVQAYCPTADEAAAHGVRRLRISPHTADMCAVSAIYRDLLDGAIAPDAAVSKLRAMNLPGALIDGYMRGKAGCEPVTAA